jgi:hypothetical protein
MQMKQLRNLDFELRELEPLVKNPKVLKVGRQFKSFKMRPRELPGNWLLSAVLAFDYGHKDWTILEAQDGDGIIADLKRRRKRVMEHVYVRPEDQRSRTVEECIVQAVAHKVKGKGQAYARGKALLVLSEASGHWIPRRTAWLLVGQHDFSDIWVAHPENIDDVRYTYCVAQLSVLYGQFRRGK